MGKESLRLIWVKRDKTYGIMPTKMHIKCLLKKKSISPLIKFLQRKEIKYRHQTSQLLEQDGGTSLTDLDCNHI